MSLTPEERAELRELHVLIKTPVGFGHHGSCNEEWEEWPCTTIRLLDALDAAEDRLHDAATVADAAEERLAIQIEANLALHEVIEELEARLYLTIPEGEREEE
jgi:hypothetical protein